MIEFAQISLLVVIAGLAAAVVLLGLRIWEQRRAVRRARAARATRSRGYPHRGVYSATGPLSVSRMRDDAHARTAVRPVNEVHEGATEEYGRELARVRTELPSADLRTPAEQMLIDHEATGGIASALIEFDRRVWAALEAFVGDAEVAFRVRERESRVRVALDDTQTLQVVR